MFLNLKPLAKTALCASLLLTATSCKDYLVEDNRSSIPQAAYFTSASQAQAAINGLYDRLRIYNGDTGYGESIWVGLDLLAGHATTLGQSQFNNQFINQTIDPANPYFSNVWNNAYNGIGSANLAITRIPAISMDETQKKALLGQAYFMRAFLYYNLVRLYGDVPLLTTPIDGTSADLYPTRSPQSDVYKLIISDLQAAETSGLPDVDRTGRISLGAVKSLLAGVYLTTAGYPLQIKQLSAVCYENRKNLSPPNSVRFSNLYQPAQQRQQKPGRAHFAGTVFVRYCQQCHQPAGCTLLRGHFKL
jgi:hypothetical protein